MLFDYCKASKDELEGHLEIQTNTTKFNLRPTDDAKSSLSDVSLFTASAIGR
jgi:hypothetical protein